MDDYQSSFSGEEIDDILAKAKSGDFTVQSDYAQNDSTQLDYIKNRPFYTIDGFSYEWDGTTPDETKKVSGDDSRYFYYKISDNIMSVSDLIGAKTTINSQKNTITESSIETYENGSFCYKFYNYELVLVCVKAGSFATLLGTVELTPGLWFMHPGFIVSLLEKEAEIKQIDNEYIAKATALDDDNADLPVTAGLVESELKKKADLVDGKIPVEQLPDGIGGGESGTLVQQQADYTQNDSTEVDFIKNRPVYTKDEYRHTVVWGDENQDYTMYKVGDIVPDLNDNFTLTLTVESQDASELSVIEYIATKENIIQETDADEIGVLIGDDGGTFAFYLLSSELDGMSPGLYIADLDTINDDVVNVGLDITMEVIYSPKKTLSPEYIPSNSTKDIVIDAPEDWLSGTTPTDIPITDLNVLAQLMGMMYRVTSARIFVRFLLPVAGETVVAPAQLCGGGTMIIPILESEHLFVFDSSSMSLVYSKTREFSSTEATETASTYGLRQPSLADTILASMEERGLTPERFKELFPKSDLTKFLNNEVTE